MSGETGFELDSKVVGALPIVNDFLRRLRCSEFLCKHLPVPDRRAKLPPALALGVILRNLILARAPLYAMGEWAHQMVPELLDLEAEELRWIGDDRLGRALDRLFDADRNALLTDLVVHMVRTFKIDLDTLHNDSTSLTLHGEYKEADGTPVRGKKTVVITQGFNKDHRPDLKQLLWILTTSADGSVPVHFRVADGNTEDSTTHIDTWKILHSLVGGPEFIYVADSKLCTHENLAFIAGEHGSFITVLPRSRSEDRLFKDWLQTRTPEWTEIHRRPHPLRENGPLDILQAVESPIPDADGFRLVWYHSSFKHEQDAQSRQACINRAWKELEAFHQVLEGPRCRHTTREGVAKAVDRILEDAHAARWLDYEIESWDQQRYRQEKAGRPGARTRWLRTTKPRFRILWRPNTANIEYDQRTDGIFPLVTNRKDLSTLDIHTIFRSKQPMLEKRHALLKNVLEATPAFLKSVSRLEALFFLFYVSLTVHALVEREIRIQMEARGLGSLRLYPEQRKCMAPTAVRIFEVFSDLQRHVLLKQDRVVQRFPPELSPIQRQILGLLRLAPRHFLQAFQPCKARAAVAKVE